MKVSESAVGPNEPPAGSSGPPHALGKDEFMKLLMTQLAHQDPLSPMDSEAFVAQLAQFANVEQLQTANSSLGSLLVASASSNQLSAASLVGRDAVFRSDALVRQPNGQSSAIVRLPEDAPKVVAVVRDETGRAVRTMQLPGAAAGDLAITWDGKDDRGQVAAPGRYRLEVSASNAAGRALTVQTQQAGRVSGVSFANGYAELLVGGVRVKMPDVVEVKQSLVSAPGDTGAESVTQ